MPERPPAAGNRAIFLSYAREDTDAARRIAEALRASGVEVWFDQSELRGGDAWDAKIRQQIRECALFMPVVSRNTQTRTEGYFRLEWRLADQRTHLMGKSKSFLLPVSIDDSGASEADVPDSFLAVQWTRLPDGVAPPSFGAHVANLLGGDLAGRAPTRRDGGSGMPERRRPLGRIGLALLVAVVTIIIVLWRTWRAPNPDQAGRKEEKSTRNAPGDARQLADQARRHFQGIFTRADLALAEELGRQASELDPTLALAWAVRAGANACYLMRGFVAGDAALQRAGDAERFAKQALAINHDETEALIALGQVAMFQNVTTQAEAYYRRVLVKEPDNPFARRYLSIVLREIGRANEAIALMQDAVRRNPRDTLSHFDLALAYTYGWDWPRAWEAADRCLALEPFPGAQMLKVRLAFQWKGDVKLMRQLLEQLDLTYRGEDDAVVWEMRCGLFERRPDLVLEAAGRTARTYLEETGISPAPKAWFTAQAYRIAGKTGLARQQWQVAESVVRERVTADPQNLELRLKLAVTLAWLGEKDKAQSELATIEATWREQLSPDRAWDLASFHAASGDAARAVPLLRQALNAGPGMAPLTVNQLKLDPWWDGIRGTPEFAELLATAPPLPQRASP